jgi:hypothetical protein
MKTVAKVAISLPTLRALERARTRLHKTRSAAVTEAIERWLQNEQVSDDDRRYVSGYLRRPERTDDAAPIASAAIANWEPWE